MEKDLSLGLDLVLENKAFSRSTEGTLISYLCSVSRDSELTGSRKKSDSV